MELSPCPNPRLKPSPDAAGEVPANPGRLRGESGCPPALSALLAQVCGIVLSALLLVPVETVADAPVSILGYALVAGIVAAGLGYRWGLAAWWSPIQLLFAPAAIWVNSIGIRPGLFLVAFGILALSYWSTFHSQVPLYLSSRKAWLAVLTLLPRRPGLKVVDIGCGLGGLCVYLSRHRPDAG